jgi:hypothetical protein
MVKFDYADYFFYKLICLSCDVEPFYVGKTKNWYSREKQHKSCCNNPKSEKYNTKKYKIIRENGGWSNWAMVKIGFRVHITEEESRVIEEEYRVKLRAEMNDRRCHATPEQLAEDKRQQSSRYYQNHKEEAAEHNKQYRQDHKEEAAEYDRQYRHTPKRQEYLRKFREQKNDCQVCGGKYMNHHKSEHLKSKKHQQALNNQASTSTDNVSPE